MRSFLDNKPLLITLIAFLAALKFILVPTLEWQEQKVIDIEKKAKRVAKGERLLTDEDELDAQLSQLTKKVTSIRKLVISEQPDAVQYQLSIQEEVEKLLSKSGLAIKRTSWLNPKKYASYEEQRMEVTINGTVKQLMQAMIAIEQLKPKIALTEMQTNLSKMKLASNRLGRVSGKIVLTGWRGIEG